MEEEKYVDESWKEAVENEKKVEGSVEGSMETVAESSPKDTTHPQPESKGTNGADSFDASSINFLNYITSLAFQVMIFLGEIPNPLNDQVEKNLNQARLLIDTLAMLREKTAGNLTKQESDMLNASLYELQMRYVEMTAKDTQIG